MSEHRRHHPSAAAAARAGGRALAAGLARAGRWLEIYSQAAVRIACVLTVLGALLATGSLAGNVFTRHVLGYSIFGAEELARFAFIWTIWMGVSLAVRRGAVTVITIVSHHGPAWWQRSLRAFSAVVLGALLAYTCVRATQLASTNDPRPRLVLPGASATSATSTRSRRWRSATTSSPCTT